MSKTFAETATKTSRLIQTTEPPELEDIEQGDLVICERTWGIEDYIVAAENKGAHIRVSNYRYQVETIESPNKHLRTLTRHNTTLASTSYHTHRFTDHTTLSNATEAFAATWDALSQELEANPTYIRADEYIPEAWLPYLPYPTLNPAQAQAVPHIMDSDKPLMVTAPTGAGKTIIGSIAALKAIKTNHGKAAWLVPQRSLTAELDQEMQLWRKQGLNVVALSGETNTDLRTTQEADLWIATTEKFEALCRSSSMRQTIAQINTLIVDEIHLLGEPGRGPTLETLLARVEAEKLDVRIIGLSATAANAAELATWLKADLIPISWRPTRQTSQMLLIADGTKDDENRERNRVTCGIIREVSIDRGSTIVFCGTKANCRLVALAVAKDRGADISGVNANDAATVHKAVHDYGIRLHYSDWPFKREAERDFREGTADVLIATSTLAAGVNLPARAVIVRETTIGRQDMEVSMVQQMFGRAGRAGKEPEGWSFLIGTPEEIATWRTKLSEGYSIVSQLEANLEDSLLGEIVQGNIQNTNEAVTWWENTFAYHQGKKDADKVHNALHSLIKAEFVAASAEDNKSELTATKLGAITARMMIEHADATALLDHFKTSQALPSTEEEAEEKVIYALSHMVNALKTANAQTKHQAKTIETIIAEKGKLQSINRDTSNSEKSYTRVSGDQVSQAGLLLAIRSPKALNNTQIMGINRSVFNPALYDSERVFAWLSAVGAVGAVPPWVSYIASRLGPRVTWKHLAPQPETGQMLAACERVIPKDKARDLLPRLYQSALQAQILYPAQLNQVQVPDFLRNQVRHVAADALRNEAGMVNGAVAVFTYQSGVWELQPNQIIPESPFVAFSARGDIAGPLWG